MDQIYDLFNAWGSTDQATVAFPGVGKTRYGDAGPDGGCHTGLGQTYAVSTGSTLNRGVGQWIHGIGRFRNRHLGVNGKCARHQLAEATLVWRTRFYLERSQTGYGEGKFRADWSIQAGYLANLQLTR